MVGSFPQLCFVPVAFGTDGSADVMRALRLCRRSGAGLGKTRIGTTCGEHGRNQTNYGENPVARIEHNLDHNGSRTGSGDLVGIDDLLDPGQVHLERGADPGLAADEDASTALLHDPVNHGKAQPRTPAELLGNRGVEIATIATI